MLVEMSKMSCKLMVGDEQGSLRHSLFVFVVFGVDARCGADFMHVFSWCQSLCIVLQLRFGEDEWTFHSIFLLRFPVRLNYHAERRCDSRSQSCNS